MEDAAHKAADAAVEAWKAEVAETYRQAQRDAQEALSRFLKRFEEQDAKRRAKVEAGELPREGWLEWRKGQMLTGQRLSSTLDQVAQAYSHANEVAVAALAGRLPEVYAENANFAAFQVCKASGLDLAFSLVDAPTVQHMLTAGEALFHVPALDVAKDVAWNRRLMASQLTQGVLLGESIPKMSRRVQSVTGSNIATATRTARTAVTGAECAGRVSSYELAKGMGIKLKQEWVAALDNRTRHSHRQLDGEKAEVGGTFSNGCRFPGDPQGRYAEICNCRYTLVAAVEGFETDDAKRASKLPKGMTYEQWKRAAGQNKQSNVMKVSDSLAPVYDKVKTSHSFAIADAVSKANPNARDVYLAYEKSLHVVDPYSRRHPQFNPSDVGVYLNLDADIANKAGKLTTWFHENGHQIDYLWSGAETWYEKERKGIRAGWQWFSCSYENGKFGVTIRKEVKEMVTARQKAIKAEYAKAMADADFGFFKDRSPVAATTISRYEKEYAVAATKAQKAEVLKRMKREPFAKVPVNRAHKAISDEIRALSDEERANLSDILGGATKNGIDGGWKHDKSYWKDPDNLPIEAFAEFFSASMASPKSLAVLKKYLPQSSAVFEDMMKELSGNAR